MLQEVRALLIGLVLAACAHPAPPPAAQPAPAPVPVAAPIAPPIEHRPGAPSWIGVRFDRKTTRVIQIVPGAPAARAGIRIGDEVTSIDGHAVVLDIEAVEQIRSLAAGVKAPFVVKRGGQPVTIGVTVGEMPDMEELPRMTLVDRPAPPFTAQLIAGTYAPVLKELAGHVVIVDFWATWCGPCSITMPFLDQWQTAYGARGLRIVGLTAEDAVDVRDFLVAHPLSYTVARDVDDKIGQLYMRSAIPMLVVIDKAGVVRHVQVGADKFDEVEAVITKLL
jgi:cytochrome c biogenesis protein CcmG/thiol:disulfide interchange protein DsbE